MRLSDFDINQTTKHVVECAIAEFQPDSLRRWYEKAVERLTKPQVADGCVQLLAYAAQLKQARDQLQAQVTGLVAMQAELTAERDSLARRCEGLERQREASCE